MAESATQPHCDELPATAVEAVGLWPFPAAVETARSMDAERTGSSE